MGGLVLPHETQRVVDEASQADFGRAHQGWTVDDVSHEHARFDFRICQHLRTYHAFDPADQFRFETRPQTTEHHHVDVADIDG